MSAGATVVVSSGATVVVSIGAGAASVAVVSPVDSDSVDVSLQAAKAPIASTKRSFFMLLFLRF